VPTADDPSSTSAASSAVPPPPEFDGLGLDVHGPVAFVTLDRPEVLNALSVELLDDLVAACRWLQDRDAVRVVVFRGAGRTFSAGADLSTLQRLMADDGGARHAAAAGDRAASAIEALDAVTIAAIHGRCVGGGIVLALACDLRFAGTGARFSIPEVDLGIPLAWGGVPRLLREVGPALARDLILTCREFDADAALAAGIVSRVVPDDALAQLASDTADELAAKAPLPVRATLDAIAHGCGIGAPAGWSDADTLLTAVRDPASREVAAAYLDTMSTPGGSSR
jgi:enoyl-CoA hydratase/carnithine racemase